MMLIPSTRHCPSDGLYHRWGGGNARSRRTCVASRGVKKCALELVYVNIIVSRCSCSYMSTIHTYTCDHPGSIIVHLVPFTRNSSSLSINILLDFTEPP